MSDLILFINEIQIPSFLIVVGIAVFVMGLGLKIPLYKSDKNIVVPNKQRKNAQIGGGIIAGLGLVLYVMGLLGPGTTNDVQGSIGKTAQPTGVVGEVLASVTPNPDLSDVEKIDRDVHLYFDYIGSGDYDLAWQYLSEKKQGGSSKESWISNQMTVSQELAGSLVILVGSDKKTAAVYTRLANVSSQGFRSETDAKLCMVYNGGLDRWLIDVVHLNRTGEC
ncbi:MAG: hypothetical protein OEZ02_08235 [Anaerolineae bacterium]|nr:hypothetical protein [Anaerolineae bacterium]